MWSIDHVARMVTDDPDAILESAYDTCKCGDKNIRILFNDVRCSNQECSNYDINVAKEYGLACGGCNANLKGDWNFCPYCRVPKEIDVNEVW